MAINYTKIQEDVSLDISSIYTDLMKASTGRGSAYLKAKETIVGYADKSDLTASEKATLVSQTIVQLTQGVTNEAMQVAFKIAQENRDAPYTLTKLKEDTRLVTAEIAKEEQGELLTAAQVSKMAKEEELIDQEILKMQQEVLNSAKDQDIKSMTVKKAQAELYRDYGVNEADLLPAVPAIAFTDYGAKHEAIKLAKADEYSKYATSYRQNGLVTLTLNSDGSLATGTLGDTNGLVTQQYKVAKRQEIAFDDNMRQHAVNSSASMISMLVSTDNTIDQTTLAGYIGSWTAAMNYLTNADGHQV